MKESKESWLRKSDWELDKAWREYKDAELSKSPLTSHLYKRYREKLTEIGDSYGRKI